MTKKQQRKRRPVELSGPVAVRVWDEMEPQLSTVVGMRAIDERCLILYCNAWQTLSEVREVLATEPRYTTSEKGYTMRHPAAVDEKDLVARIRQLGAELGMSPKARGPIKAKSMESDDLAEFIGDG